MLIQILEDAFFAAIAAIGFAAVSRPSRKAYLYCAIVAAIGHSVRFTLMRGEVLSMHIVGATVLSAFLVGTLAVFLSKIAKIPAETFLYPGLLPMVPGVFAYKCFAGACLCLLHPGQEDFEYYFYQFSSNGMLSIFILFAMAIGATLPIFFFKQISFTATRSNG